MKLNATNLRANLYQIIDKVIETGIPVEIERKGQTVKLIPVTKRSKLDNLTSHPGVILGNPDDLVHMDWFHHWKYEDDLS